VFVFVTAMSTAILTQPPGWERWGVPAWLRQSFAENNHTFVYVADGTESGNWTWTWSTSVSLPWVLAQYRADSGHIEWDFASDLIPGVTGTAVPFAGAASRVDGLPVIAVSLVFSSGFTGSYAANSADWSVAVRGDFTTSLVAIHEGTSTVTADTDLPAAGAALSFSQTVIRGVATYLILTETDIDLGFGHVGKFGQVNSVGATTAVIPAPTDQQAGDNILLMVGGRDRGADVTAWPAGFTEIYDETTEGTGGRLWMALGPAGGGSYTVTFSTTQFACGIALRVPRDHAITIGTPTKHSTSTAVATVPAISSTKQNAQAIWYALAYNAPSTSFFQPDDPAAAGGLTPPVTASRLNWRAGWRFRQEPGEFPAISGTNPIASEWILGQILLEPVEDPDWGSLPQYLAADFEFEVDADTSLTVVRPLRADFEFEYDAEVGLVVERRLTADFDFEVEFDADVQVDTGIPQYLAADFEFEFDADTSLTVARGIRADFEFEYDAEVGLLVERRLAADFEFEVVPMEIVDAGPGTGLVVGTGASGADAYQKIVIVSDRLGDFGEGDEFVLVLPDRDVEGMVGVARVLARTDSDDNGLPTFELAFWPYGQAEFTPRQAKGGGLPLSAQKTAAGQQNRLERQLDLMRRQRGRDR